MVRSVDLAGCNSVRPSDLIVSRLFFHDSPYRHRSHLDGMRSAIPQFKTIQLRCKMIHIMALMPHSRTILRITPIKLQYKPAYIMALISHTRTILRLRTIQP
jgi:hypothetical protein